MNYTPKVVSASSTGPCPICGEPDQVWYFCPSLTECGLDIRGHSCQICAYSAQRIRDSVTFQWRMAVAQ